MKLQLINSFHCPEGKWRGRCEAIEEPKKPALGKCKDQVRIRFSVETDEGQRMVARTFCADLRVGGELHGFLNSWLGGDLESLLDEQNEIDLDLLIDEEADLYIVHGKKTAQYAYPVVMIAGIYPPGRLVKG